MFTFDFRCQTGWKTTLWKWPLLNRICTIQLGECRIHCTTINGFSPIKVGWLCKSKSLRPIALDSWNFLCRFQIDMALSGNFFGAMQCVLPGEKTPNTTFAAPVRLRLVSKIHKKLIEFFHKSVILTVAAKMGEKAFFLNLKIIFCIFLLIFWWFSL